MRATVLLLALAFVSVPFAGCLEDGGAGAPASGNGDARELDARTLAKGQNSAWHTGSRAVIDGQDAWDRWWREHATNGSMPPGVDFPKERVLALVLSDRPDTCHAVEITRALSDPEAGRVIVTAVEQGPEPGEACGAAITQPYHVVAVPNTGEPVEWDVTLWTPPSEDREAERVEWSLVDEGLQSGIHENETHVVRTQAEWDALWARHASNREPAPPAPEVDFTKHRVVAFFAGGYSDPCRAFDVTKVERSHADEILVHVLHTEARGGGCTTVMAFPFAFLAIPAGDAPVGLRWTHAVKDANPDDGSGNDANGDTPPEPAPGPVEWSRLEHGQQSGIHENKTVVVESDAEWAALWENHTANRIPAPERPRVDFTEHRVLAVFMGERSNGCYGVDVTGVHVPEDQGPAVVANVTWYHPSPGAVCTEAITHPFVMITIPAGDSDVTIRGRAEAVGSP